MNKKNIIAVVVIIVLLAAMAVGFWKYQKNYSQKSLPSGLVLADKQRNFTPDQRKIYTDKIVKAKDYLTTLNPKQANFSNEQFNTYVFIGQQYHGLGEFQKAKEYYDKALAIRPTDEQATVGLSMVLIEAGEKDVAATLLQKALENNPKNYDVWIRYIDLRATLGASDQDLDSLYKQALEKTERYIDVVTKYAEFQEKLGKVQEAIELWREAVKLYPDNAAMYNAEIQRLQRIK